MTNRKLLKVGAGLAFAFTAAACNSDKLTNLNTNPNSPEDVPPGPLFTNAARVAASRWLGTAYSLRQTEWLSQHLRRCSTTTRIATSGCTPVTPKDRSTAPMPAS